MSRRSHTLDLRLADLEKEVASLRTTASVAVLEAIDRWRMDAAALQFHLGASEDRPLLIAVLGGTGTGKSTLVNRLIDADVSVASFRRTFTSGAVAAAPTPSAVPAGWLGIEHRLVASNELPVRGAVDALMVVVPDSNPLRRMVLVDTPDLDGDQPLHHAQADRVFRWADAALFLVSPEKYQMTELIPYYRLARRYELPALFVMNKCQTAEMLEDYRELLKKNAPPSSQTPQPVRLFAVPRDDAGWQPPADENLEALRAALQEVRRPDESARRHGIARRAADLMGRLADHIIAPARHDRRQADKCIAFLRAMETPPPGVDVNPVTHQLQRRLQQRSVLYLIGPRRILDRARQTPGLLLRLPRTMWDVVMHGKTPDLHEPDDLDSSARRVPDFHAALVDQFSIIQSRIDDALRGSAGGEQWITQDPSGWERAKIDPQLAGKIADEELADLRAWLEKRWNATPRDTLLMQRLLKYMPGGAKLTQWSEAAPYLLTIVLAAHGALFGHVDLLIIGGYSAATWLMEKLSNEVAVRTRLANRRITERFAALAHEQINGVIGWLDTRAPKLQTLDKIERRAEEIASP